MGSRARVEHRLKLLQMAKISVVMFEGRMHCVRRGIYAGGCEMHRSGVAVEGGEAGAVVEVCLGRGATCSFKRPLQLCLSQKPQYEPL